MTWTLAWIIWMWVFGAAGIWHYRPPENRFEVCCTVLWPLMIPVAFVLELIEG